MKNRVLCFLNDRTPEVISKEDNHKTPGPYVPQVVQATSEKDNVDVETDSSVNSEHHDSTMQAIAIAIDPLEGYTEKSQLSTPPLTPKTVKALFSEDPQEHPPSAAPPYSQNSPPSTQAITTEDFPSDIPIPPLKEMPLPGPPKSEPKPPAYPPDSLPTHLFDDCSIMELRHMMSHEQLPPWEFPGVEESEGVLQRRAEELSKLSINDQLHFAEIHDLFALALHGIQMFRAPGPITTDTHHKDCPFRLGMIHAVSYTIQVLAATVTAWQSNPHWAKVHIPWPSAIDDFQWYCQHLTTVHSGVSQ